MKILLLIVALPFSILAFVYMAWFFLYFDSSNFHNPGSTDEYEEKK